MQHGYRDNDFGDAEATGALLARLAAVRDWVKRPASSTWRRPQSGTLAGVPFETTRAHDAAATYLGLLDRVLEDRVVTEAEVRRLREVAAEWGIGALEADRLHRSYVARVWEQAWADETITLAELRDIELLAKLLGVPVETPHQGTGGGARARWVAVPIEAGVNMVEPVSEDTSLSRGSVGEDPSGRQGGGTTTRPQPERTRR